MSPSDKKAKALQALRNVCIVKHCSINVLLTYFLTKGWEFLFSFLSPLVTFIMPATTAETTSIFLQWSVAPSLLVYFQKNSAFCIVFLPSRAQFLKMLLRGGHHPPFTSAILLSLLLSPPPC